MNTYQKLSDDTTQQPTYIDLSHLIDADLPTHPLDDSIDIKRHRYIESDGYNDTKLNISMHIGTHMDAPSHLTDMNQYISDLPLDQFIGKGILLDFREKEKIDLDDEMIHSIDPGDIVVFHTGLYKQFGTDHYFNKYPDINERTAGILVDKKVKMVAMDTFSPDHHPFLIHKTLLGHQIPIIENLTNLDQLVGKKSFDIIAIPMKIKAEGSPVRVIAKLID